MRFISLDEYLDSMSTELKEEALEHTLQRTCIGRGYGPVIRQTTESMK